MFNLSGQRFPPIYNLKTTGLAAGRYVLSFYAVSDRTFFYTVEFEVK